MLYKDFDTNEIYTIEELKETYKIFADEMEYTDFEDFFEEMLSQGRQGIGGLVEA